MNDEPKTFFEQLHEVQEILDLANQQYETEPNG